MPPTLYDLAKSTEANTSRMAMTQEVMTMQMSGLLGINLKQLAVQHEQLAVQHEQLTVQQQQLWVQDQIRSLNKQQLAVNEQQLMQALRTVGRLDVTNHRLAGIDASLADISGLLAQQNALVEKSLNRLATDAQELLRRGMEAYRNDWVKEAARDFSASIDKYPYEPLAHYYVAKCLARDGRAEDVEQAYQKCIYYARIRSPFVHSLALCDLARRSLDGSKADIARQHIHAAQQCSEKDKTILASMLLQCDIAEGNLRPETSTAIETAFDDEQVDPEVLLEVLSCKMSEVHQGEIKKQLEEAKPKWMELARKAMFERTISHFYRELDDYVYLAPRIRRWFMEAADKKFLSLGDPLADILDWTVMIGEELLKRIDLFTPGHLPILPIFRPLHEWNALLVRLGKLTGLLAAKSPLVSGQFVGQLNLGLLELPRMYEDDRIIFEVKTEEGDSLALSCYYAVFSRSGVDHISVPLHEFSLLQFETYPARRGSKGVLVVHPRYGQTLIQGTTGSFMDEAKEEVYFIDLFVEAASLLSQIHDAMQWTIRHEHELFSIFLLLHAVTERLARSQPRPSPKPQSPNRPTPPLRPDGKKEKPTDDNFEVVEDTPPARGRPASRSTDDDFEVVEDAGPVIPPNWYYARNNRKIGPVSWSRLQELVVAGEIQPTDMLLHEGTNKWVAAKDVPELSLALTRQEVGF